VSEDDELLAKKQVLGDQGCPRNAEGQNAGKLAVEQSDHDSERLPRHLLLRHRQ
jgi:hypothetical protein